jgi:hypothetical protein
MALTGVFEADGDILNPLQAKPQALGAGFVVAFAGEESTVAGDQTYDLVEAWRRRGRWLFGQDVGGPPFLGLDSRSGTVRPRRIRRQAMTRWSAKASSGRSRLASCGASTR